MLLLCAESQVGYEDVVRNALRILRKDVLCTVAVPIVVAQIFRKF